MVQKSSLVTSIGSSKYLLPFMSVSLFVFGEFYARIWERVVLFIFNAGWNEPLNPPTSVFCAL